MTDPTPGHLKTTRPRYIGAILAIGLAWMAQPAAEGQGQFQGLEIRPEYRCSPYERSRDYRYPQSIEAEIARQQGGLYGPYTGRWFTNRRETDIEHIVAAAEAHDSGLCAAVRGTRTRFAQDLLNLTLAGPNVNRNQKSDRDAGEWLPAMNRCLVRRADHCGKAALPTVDRSARGQRVGASPEPVPRPRKWK